jgi:two-component system chemotaxis response regulator CheY
MAELTSALSSPPRRILIVDDALTVRLFYRQVLEAAGFAISEAGNGLEGLERAAEAPPDLFIVDINMPKMDGYAMLRALRADGQTRAIPAIMISTEAQSSDAAQGYAAGANLYLIKPVRPDLLRSFAQLMTGVVAE